LTKLSTKFVSELRAANPMRIENSRNDAVISGNHQ